MPRPAGNCPDLPGAHSSNMYAEMSAFDRLGPLTRAAIREARFPFSAVRLIEVLLESGVRIDEMGDPHVDRAGARATRETDAKLAFRFATEEGRLWL